MDKAVIFKWLLVYIAITDLALLIASIIKPEWWGAFLLLAIINGTSVGYRFVKEGVYSA